MRYMIDALYGEINMNDLKCKNSLQTFRIYYRNMFYGCLDYFLLKPGE